MHVCLAALQLTSMLQWMFDYDACIMSRFLTLSLQFVVDVESGQPLFKCQTCPYIYSVDREVS